jgi:hypothetical protein
MIIEQNATVQNTHQCEKNIDTQFISDNECGDGINDRITSDGEGRVTSDGQCRTIA